MQIHTIPKPPNQKVHDMGLSVMIFIEQDLILKEDKGAYNHV
jgi:hypothetical protein